MATKCNTCGAPQQITDSNTCIFCGGILNNLKHDDDLMNEFIPIKYEFNQSNYSKVINLTDNYLKKDIFNIPCWSFKIFAEFLKISIESEEFDFQILNKSLTSLLDLQITNSLSQKVIEKHVLLTFQLINDNYNNKVAVKNFDAFKNLLSQNFSKEFLNICVEKFDSIKKIDRNDFDMNDKDSLFEDAALLIVASQSGSASLLQRRMKLGYNRAGRLMDQLEAAGIVGPNKGDKVRDVLIKTDAELREYLNNAL